MGDNRGYDYRAAGIAVGLAWLVLSWPWFSGVVTIPYDGKAVFQAQLQFLANALHSGQSPFWNPSAYVGMPQIADPQSLIFTPAFFLAYFEKAPSFRQLDVYVFGMLGLAAFCVLKHCQDRGWHPAGGAVAAIAFAFGGSAAWRVQHIAQIQSYAFFGMTLWLLHRALDKRSATYGALVGLSGGLMVIAPDQVAVLACYALIAIVAGHFCLSADPPAAIRQSAIPLGVATVVGAAIAAVPLLVTFLFLASSNRPDMVFAESAHGSLHPASLLTAIVGDLYGALDPNVDYWGPFSMDWDPSDLTLSQNMSQVYFGVLPVMLIVTAGITRGLLWTRELRPLVILLAVMVLYALGTNTPIFYLFYKALPGVSFFRRPADATFLVDGLAAVVGGYLVHRWASASIPSASYRTRYAELGILLALFATSLAVAITKEKFGVAWKPMLYAIGWLAAAALLLAVPTALLRKGGHRVTVVAAAFMTLDLAINNGPNPSTGLPPSSYDILTPYCKNKTVRLLDELLKRPPKSPWRDRIELVGLGFEWPNVPLVHGFEHTLGYNPLRMGVVSDAVGARDYIVGPEQRVFAPLFPSYRSVLANMLGLRFIASSIPIEQVDKTLRAGDLKLVARTEDAYIYENLRVLPRAMFVSKWKISRFDRLLHDGKWPDFDPTETVILEEAPLRREPVKPPPAQVAASAAVRIATYSNTHIVIEVDAAEDGFVILNDVWQRWWVADVDGQSAPIMKANVMFRAVSVPAGRHVVHFDFRPMSGGLADLRERLFGQGQRVGEISKR